MPVDGDLDTLDTLDEAAVAKSWVTKKSGADVLLVFPNRAQLETDVMIEGVLGVD